ncbi:hypothetical protein [Clostridium sardiniense]|uniref:hypothetical protein n=1 Tax=Clostridium sardiniense TaxID=29369 RepID=UPI0019581EB7|nr:hypothetical protein [Clostridium sardiniense]MBM7835851.1 hypothetical protein [Clostridium sardiniense]
MNKNFIPEKFIEKQDKKYKRSINRGLLMILICNLLILPINISNIIENKKNINNVEIENSIDNKISYSKKEILKWIEVLDLYTSFGEIKNNSGEILMINDKYLKDIKENLDIIKINNYDEGYSLNVVGDNK